jgi:recombination protein RecT
MNAIIPTEQQEEKGMTRIANYLEAAPVQKKFSEIMGERGAKSYVASVLIAVAESTSLQKCAPDSIYISALRAATLRLSVDASTGQAYLVPFKGRATLIVGYKGLHDMAVRTNRYRYINVGPVYEGEEVIENRMTGLHSMNPHSPRTSKTVIGWIGAFEMVNNYAHTLYMTCEEIHEHAKQYSKGYDNADGAWKKETAKMERKTVLRLLLRRWGFLDPADVQQLNQIDEDEIIEAPLALDNSIIAAAEEIDKEPKRTTAETIKQLGFDNPDPVPGNMRYDYMLLVERAKAVNVPYIIPNWDTVTKPDFTAEGLQLLGFVTAAEAQVEAEGSAA